MGIGTLLVRADASPEIGTGHIMRCLALAQAWQERGGRAAFLMAQSTASVSERLSHEQCEIIPCAAQSGDSTDARITAETSCQLGSNWLVLDGYAFDSEYEVRVSGRGANVLFVDDLGGGGRVADIILNPNLTASESQYAGCSNRLRLLGAQYALLRREFRQWTDWRREVPAKGGKVMVTLGGSTPNNVALCILQALTELKSQLGEVLFIVGASSTDATSLVRSAQPLEGKITFHRAATDMAALMACADVAIAAAGSTCWEMCFMGLPALVMDVAENQTAEALELHRQGCANYLGNGNALRPEKLVSELSTLLHSQDLRREVSFRCRNLVDGHGAQRVVSAMLGELSVAAHLPRQEALA